MTRSQNDDDERVRNNMIKHFIFLVIFLISAPDNGYESELELLREDRYKTFYKIAYSSLARMSKARAWRTVAQGVEEITIRSSADSTMQRALFYNSGSSHTKPLLLVLHSWSADYMQHFSIPYGVWAEKNDWVFIHPDYRGAYTNPKSTASELAIQDILDALAWAKANARIDTTRVYITGFSGGAMTTLIMVGRYPELWTAAAAWVPVYDLVEWYQTTKGARHDYSGYIENSCGGPPVNGNSAEKECRKRSVSSYLSNARRKEVHVYIATGIEDNFVPPSHSIRAFNDLAYRRDRIPEKYYTFIDKNHRLPPAMTGYFADSLYTDAGRYVLFEKKSRNAILKIFDGRHDVIYNAGLFWLSKQKKD
ncbi:MAG: prolyl oligopeptidase family serine peptidase [Chitinivibrionales bacterium]|nr:prolyl oligopeptidase family serine peptidase [Chitinivibrionales bacterium]